MNDSGTSGDNFFSKFGCLGSFFFKLGEVALIFIFVKLECVGCDDCDDIDCEEFGVLFLLESDNDNFGFDFIIVSSASSFFSLVFTTSSISFSS